MSSTIHWQPRYAIWIALQEDGESAKDVAQRMGWDASKLSRIITGDRKKVDIEEWQAIAAAQGRELDYYLDPPTNAHNPRNVVMSGRSYDPFDLYILSDIVRAAA